MKDTFAGLYLQDIVLRFRSLKRLADRAIAQLDDPQWFIALDGEANSVAIIVKHVAGNMHSRWTDFLIADGEKPDRNRDTEFELDQDDKATLVARWETGWSLLLSALESLTVDDLARTVFIRQEPHRVPEAIHRQLSHYAYHIGQLVFLCKHLKGSDWQSLSIPRGESGEFNEMMRTRKKHGS